MNIGKISVSNIRHKPLSAFLSILLLAFGVGIIIMLMGTTEQLEKQFTKNIKGIDMVVGAKGSPLQLILSSVYQIDAPTGNISLQEFNKLAKNPLIEKAIPLAYGDNYEGYRIVGTSTDYAKHYEAQLAEGVWWAKGGEVTMGAKAAELTGATLGTTFSGSHGLVNDMDHHHHYTYTVVGIMAPTGTVLDKLILTDVSSVWDVHATHEEEEHTSKPTAPTYRDSNNAVTEVEMEAAEPHQAEDGHLHTHDSEHNHTAVASNKSEAHHSHEAENHHEHEHSGKAHNHDEENREITAGLIRFRSPMGNLTIPRMVNQNTYMQAALPAIEVNRLFSLMGTSVQILRILAFLIVLLSAISVFISLYQSLKERKFELALMRSMGASSGQLLLIVLIEGMVIATLGYIFGLVLGKAALFTISQLAEGAYQYSLKMTWLTINEALLLPAALGIGFVAALLPAIQAYRLNISKVLSDA
jgi:putative ABC transport system permease protein